MDVPDVGQCSLFERPLKGFHFWTTMNNSAININIHVFKTFLVFENFVYACHVF